MGAEAYKNWVVCVYLVTQSCPSLCSPMDCSPPGSSVHRIFQARILEWVSIAYSRESSSPKYQTHKSCEADSLPLEPLGKSCKTEFNLLQLFSCGQLFAPSWTVAHQAFLSITNSQSLLKLTSIELVMSSPSPPAFSLSQHQSCFQWVSSSHQVAKVLELQLQHQAFQWILRTYFLQVDWFDLLAVQGTLKSLLQLSRVTQHQFWVTC